jgi:predicted DNA-binding WGR domain protein
MISTYLWMKGGELDEEIDDIDFQDEKKKLYKVSYRSGTKITRMYDNINSSGSNKKSSRQQSISFVLFQNLCF